MSSRDLNNIQEAQSDMKNGYGYGSVGVFISGIVWVIASLIVSYYSPQKGIWTLLIGGILITPVSMVIGKLIGVKGKHIKSNPLGKLAMEGTIWMIMCIPLAYGLSLVKVEWFFQGMLMIIGGRYLTFASIYGLRVYWALGVILALATYMLFKIEANSFISAIAGGLIEIIFSVIIYSLYKFKKN